MQQLQEWLAFEQVFALCIVTLVYFSCHIYVAMGKVNVRVCRFVQTLVRSNSWPKAQITSDNQRSALVFHHFQWFINVYIIFLRDNGAVSWKNPT